MNARIQFAFLALILAQAAHSVEEYAFRLYDVWPPARFICSLVSDDLARGFVISNSALVLFGLGCYLVPVRMGHRSAKVWVWVWIIIELVNGIGHTVIALTRGAYFPGVATAPLLLALSIYLVMKMAQFQPHGRPVA